MKLNVKEIFYSLQGEGGRSGEPSVFIRLTKCNLACDFCDTDFAEGQDMSVEEILNEIKKYPSRWIIWTGGEPTIQLNNEYLQVFKDAGYKQAIETNGTRKVPELIDYVACSPKQKYEKARDLNPVVDEIRIPIKNGDVLPEISLLPKAAKYFVSPIFDGNDVNMDNINYCVELVKNNPVWTLSLQVHKLIMIE
ncbi:MAG: 7-carboxy-7-deazaguanine synthase QueE [Dysgonomonas sp.]